MLCLELHAFSRPLWLSARSRAGRIFKVLELIDGEVEMFQGCRLLVRVVGQQQLGDLQASEGQLRTKTGSGTDVQGLFVITHGLSWAVP